MPKSLFLLVILASGLFAAGPSFATEGIRPPPRFAPPQQKFDRTVLAGPGGQAVSCESLFGSSADPGQLRQELGEWKKLSRYTDANLDRLLQIEMDLPPEQITYLHFRHVDTPAAFTFVRIFAGEGADRRPVPLVMERKFKGLVVERAERNFELGLLTKSEEMGDVVEPMMREVLKYLSHEAGVDGERTMIWATARAAQTRLYRSLGFQDTGLKTSDGMSVLKASLAELVRVNLEQDRAPLPLLSAEEYRRVREESQKYSASVRSSYRYFWAIEEELSRSPDKEERQWQLLATMRPAFRPASHSWIIHEREDDLGYQRQQLEKAQDHQREARAAAAALVHQDRSRMRLTTSPVLRKIAYYQLDYRDEHRFNRHFTLSTFAQPTGSFGAIRMSITVTTAHSDWGRDLSTQSYNQMMMDAERADRSLHEPW